MTDFLDLRQQRLRVFGTTLAKQLDAHLTEAILRAGADPSETHRFTKQSDRGLPADTYFVDGQPALHVGPPRMEGDSFTVPFRFFRPAVCCDFHNSPATIEAHLARWAARYGKTEAGEPIEPPPGWRILPFRVTVPAAHREYGEGLGWLPPRRGRSTMTPLFARPAGPVRAYAVPLEQVNTK